MRSHSGVSCFQTHSNMWKSRRGVEQLLSFGKPLTKVQRNRNLEGVQDSQMERILSEQRDIHDFLENES